MSTNTATQSPNLFAGLRANGEGRHAEAVELLTAYLENQTDHPLARSELAEALMRLGNEAVTDGKYSDAEALFERAVAVNGSPAAVFSRSHCRLMRGDVDGYLEDFERRWDVPEYRAQYVRPWHDDVRLWAGGIVNGTLLIHGEQGAGDIIQAMRHLYAVEWWADRIVLEVRQELVRLAEVAFPKLEVVRRGDTLPWFRAHLPTGSLGRVYGTPWGLPYLDGVVAGIGAIPGRIGLCWAGSPANPRDQERSIPVKLFAPLMRGEWVNLTQVRSWPSDCAPVASASTCADLLDTARLVATCGLVITCDTAIGHLAGALGVPCWLLVSKYPDPRWRLTGDTTDLYPGHRIFRQQTRGDWAGVIGAVQTELENHNGN